MGTKKATQRTKKEYKRYRKLLMEAARAKRKEDSVSSERLHSEGSSGGGHRGAREEAGDLYSDPLYRVGDLIMILKDTRPGVIR